MKQIIISNQYGDYEITYDELTQKVEIVTASGITFTFTPENIDEIVELVKGK